MKKIENADIFIQNGLGLEIFMDKIMIELCEHYHMQLLTSFTRQILNKRMPKLNGYQGAEKGLQSTMTREHILIFVRSDSKNE